LGYFQTNQEYSTKYRGNVKETLRLEKQIKMAKTKNQNKKITVNITKRKLAKRREVTRLGSALRALGGLGGSAVGSLVGMPMAGAAHGTSLGATLSKWLGSGDYQVNNNSIVQQTLRGTSSIPSMHNNGQTVVVRHKEFVTEVRGSIAFKVRASFELNPGRAATFPWLSAVASRFQEYRIRGLVWHYVPSSGSAVSSSNAALGTVMLQTSYRSNDSEPINKAEVLNEYWSSEAVPSEAFCHPIECDPKENPFNVQYVRTGSVPDGDSTLLYDLGRTHLCVSGQQVSDTVLGDLWCTYEVELKKPIIESNVTSPTRAADVLTNGVVTSASYFNGSTTIRGGLDVTANVKTLSFPPQLTGIFMVTLTILATTTFSTLDLSGSSTLVNCSNLPMPNGASYYRTVLVGAGTINQGTYQLIVMISDKAQQASITFPGTFTGASAQSIVSVAPFNYVT